MRAILLVSLLAAMALAGCSSAPTTHVCATGPKAGQTIDLTTATLAAPGHAGNGTHDAGPEAYCPPHVAPSMFFTKVPKNITAYQPFTLEWKVSNGTYAHGHAMLSVVMSSLTAVTGSPTIKAYTTELAKKEHQEVPATFTSATLVFEEPGMRHLRIFSNVQGDGLTLTTFHSDELMLTIGPVPAGKDHPVAIPPGFNSQTAKVPEVGTIALGDSVSISNGDVLPHTIAYPTTCTAASPAPAPTTLNAGASVKISFMKPGTCEIAVSTGGQAALQQILKVNVPAPT